MATQKFVSSQNWICLKNSNDNIVAKIKSNFYRWLKNACVNVLPSVE